MVVALDSKTLLLTWCFRTAIGSNPLLLPCPPARTTKFGDCNMASGFSGVPVISEQTGDVYISDDDGNLFGLFANGTLKWAVCAQETERGILSNVAPPLVDANEILYVSFYQNDPNHASKEDFDNAGLLVAVDGRTGTFLWTFSPQCNFSGTIPCGSSLNRFGAVLSPPVLTVNGSLLFGATGFLYALDSSAACPAGPATPPAGGLPAWAFAVIAVGACVAIGGALRCWCVRRRARAAAAPADYATLEEAVNS
jgi:outer membrane protein assembly factor BamB